IARGKIAPVDDKSAAKEVPKEVVKLAKGEADVSNKKSGKGDAAAKEKLRALEDDAVVREKALVEANTRIAQLEKSIKEMQRLMELKGMAPGSKPESAKAEPAKAAPVQTEAPKAEATKEVPKSEPAKEAPKVDAAKEADKQVEPPKAEAVPKAKPKPVAPPPPPPPEPDLLEQLTSEPIYLGGAGLLALLGVGGYVVARRRRSQSDAQMGGAQNDTGLTPQGGSLSPAVAVPVGLPMVDDVDPLAEADLYLNFGRDVQAEEVLKDALAKNPGHEEVKLKLLQIYAGRKDKELFETVAKDLFAQTGGTGDLWLRAAGLGYALDPENAMYDAGRDVPQEQLPAAIATGGTDLDFDLELAQEEGVSTSAKPDFELDADKTVLMKPGELAGLAAEMSAMRSPMAESADTMAAPAEPGQELDISLDIHSPAPIVAETPDLILDIPDGSEVNAAADGAKVAASSNMIDFNFDSEEVVEPAAPVAAEADFSGDETVVMTPEMASSMSGNVDFELGEQVKSGTEAFSMPDLNLDVPMDQPEELGAPASPSLPALNLDDISLNFEIPQTEISAGEAAVADAGPKDDHWYDVQTKFDLAKAYQEMGDKDGAIEILREVIKDGDVAQQAEANALLESLS
ncbi:MAG: FimV/HubP family polar landmark protein, partial [Betaproteobacteria bacterium]